jgi:hypothetical protein
VTGKRHRGPAKARLCQINAGASLPVSRTPDVETPIEAISAPRTGDV